MLAQIKMYDIYNFNETPIPIKFERTSNNPLINDGWVNNMCFFSKNNSHLFNAVSYIKQKNDSLLNFIFIHKSENKLDKNLLKKFVKETKPLIFNSFSSKGEEIIFISDSLLAIADTNDIVTCKNGKYAYNYYFYVSEKCIEDTIFTKKYSTQNYLKDSSFSTNSFSFNEDRHIKNLSSINTQLLNRYNLLKKWLIEKENNISRQYKGEIIKGKIAIYINYNKNGTVANCGIIRGFDSQTNAFILKFLEDLPNLEPIYNDAGVATNFSFDTIYITIKK